MSKFFSKTNPSNFEKKIKTKKSQFQVCPHAGGVGLCEMVQHLQMFDYVALSGTTGKKFFNFPLSIHSSLVDYLAQVIYTKNCPTTFYCIFQFVWVPMTTAQNIRVCLLSSRKNFFSQGSPFEFIYISFLQRGDPYEKSVFWS